tara:strand:+ start:84 stop:377 length:294 start_codon:yes stop_codon:yes gene_type:complete
MAFIPITLQTAMGAAFQAGVLAMEVKAKQNSVALRQKVSEADIRKAGGDAFAAVAGPAIDAYIRSATVTTIVAGLTSPPLAYPVVGTGSGLPGVGLS